MVGACRPSGPIWIHPCGRTREDSFAPSTRILPSRRRRALLVQEPAEFQDASGVGPTEDATQGAGRSAANPACAEPRRQGPRGSPRRGDSADKSTPVTSRVPGDPVPGGSNRFYRPSTSVYLLGPLVPTDHSELWVVAAMP